MRRRLETLEETRHRITAAAFELHATIGPSRTTISAIADRAGVQRHTVYAHFPDLDGLYRACTEHGIVVTGMPTAASWAGTADPSARLRVGLAALFGWYRANERMLRNVLYDVDPAAPAPNEPDLFELRMGVMFDALADGWAIEAEADRPTLLAVLTHAMAFETWGSLARAGLTDEAAVELLVSIVDALVGGSLTARVRSGTPPGAPLREVGLVQARPISDFDPELQGPPIYPIRDEPLVDPIEKRHRMPDPADDPARSS